MVMFDDAELALQFSGKMRDVLKQVRGSKGNQWRLWNDKKWVRLQSREEFRALVRQFLQQKANGCDAKKFSNCSQVRMLLESHGKLTQVSGEIELRIEMLSEASSWDSKPYLIGTPNGVVDLKTGEFRAAKKSDMISLSTSVDPAKPGEEPKAFLQFMNAVFQGDQELINWMQTFLGHAITGEKLEHIIAVWLGKGRNGKNTLIERLQSLLGPYAVKIGIEALLDGASSSSYAAATLCRLDGARLAIADEPAAGTSWNTATINQLTGDMYIPCKRLYENPREFLNTSKMVILANNEPRLGKVNEAERRRFKIISFDRVFTESEVDQELPRKLHQELPQIFRWIIDGAVKYYAHGLPDVAKIDARSRLYVESQDVIGTWFNGHYDFSPKGQIGAHQVFVSFKKFCEAEHSNGSACKMTRTELMRELVSRYGSSFSITHRNQNKPGGGDLIGVIEKKAVREPVIDELVAPTQPELEQDEFEQELPPGVEAELYGND